MRRLHAGAWNPDSNGQKSATMESVKPLHIKQYPIHRSGNSNPFSKPLKFKSLLLFASIAAIAFGIAFYLLFGSRRHGTGRKFGVIIDGGSTGSRIHVFEYRIEDGMPKFDFGPRGLSSMRVNPGLSSYAEDPQSAGESLVELLEFAKERVPSEFRGQTEVRLMATAGLRLLDVKLQERILSSCRGVIRSSEFKFRDDWASVITGSDEGLYAWVAANYALGSLGGDPQQTTGIIELGGASIQVTFVSHKEVPAEFSRSVEYGNVIYTLYSQSLLQFGQNVAFASVRELLRSSGSYMASGSRSKESIIDPCTLKGTPEVDPQDSSSAPSSSKGTPVLLAQGNFSDCKDAALMLFERKDQCSSQQCSAGIPHLPKLNGKFLATENFFYTSEFFHLDPKASLSDLVEAGKRFCQSEWASVRRKHPLIHEQDLLHYCFSSAYIVALLHDHLGVAMDDKMILYTNHVKQMPLDWALGAFILQSEAGRSGNHRLDWLPSFLRVEFPNLFLLLVATGILCFVARSITKLKNPYFKTIYDLEKGRYIITRISR